MATAMLDQMETDFLNAIIKKSKITITKDNRGVGNVLSRESIGKMSNVLTSLQNTFNQILTYQANINAINAAQSLAQAHLRNENAIENVSDNIPEPIQSPGTDISSLKPIIPAVEKLTKLLKKLDMSHEGSGIGSAVANAAESVIPITRTAKIIKGAVGGLAAAGVAYAAYEMLNDEEQKSDEQRAKTVPPQRREAGQSSVSEKQPRNLVKSQDRNSERLVQSAEIATRNATQKQTIAPKSDSIASKFADFIGNAMKTVVMASPIGLAAMAGNAIVDFFSGEPAGNSANARAAMDYFISQGWTPEQAAGIVGNLQQESGPNLDPNIHNSAGGNLGAYGLAQWRGDRKSVV